MSDEALLAAASAAALDDGARQAGTPAAFPATDPAPAPDPGPAPDAAPAQRRKVAVPQDVTAGNAPRKMPDVTTGEVIGAAASAEAIDTDYWWLNDREFNDRLDALMEVAKGVGEVPRGFGGLGGAPNTMSPEEAMLADGPGAPRPGEMSQDERLATILRAREKNPAAFEGMAITRDEIVAQVNADLRAEWDDAQAVMNAAPDTFTGRMVPEFLGRAGTAMTDEVNLPLTALTMGVGANATLGRLMLTEGALAVVGEAATIPKMYQVAERLDTPEPNAALQLAFAATVGAAAPAALRGAGKAIGGGITLGRRIGTNREIVASLRASASELVPAQRAALNAVERQVAEEDAGPAARGSENWRETDRAAADIDAGRPPAADIPAADPARVEALTTPPREAPAEAAARAADAAAAAAPRLADPARPITASIGDLIRDSEARGSYDTPSDFTVVAPPKRLTAMTLDEVDAWQNANRAAGAESTAAGGYQIIRDTLRKLRRDLGLTGAERFDADMQDRLRDELLRQAGLEDFEAGRIDADAFGDRLAQTWAAFPDASGRSVYAGDGLNAATITRDTLMSVITGRPYVSSGRPAPRMTRVAASTVTVDPKTYQFRTAVDEGGVGTPMDRVSSWDELLAGDFILHQRRDGTLNIADGHHRKQLADRLEAEGAAPIEFNAFVLREDEGYSVEHVRAIAAVKNIEAGNASAVDAAKVLRVDPAMLQRLTLRNSQARDARGLMQLSDDGFDMVTNGLVREDQAAFVPTLTRDPEMQDALLRALIRMKPKSMAEARQIANDAYRAGLAKRDEGAQNSLFGDDFDPAETLMAERATVMGRALAQLRSDKRVFATLVRERTRIQEAGNALTDESNAARLGTDELALGLIERLVNRAGPVDDALNAAARGLRSGGSTRAAVAEFTGFVRTAIEGGDLARLLDGGDGSARNAAAPDARADEGAAPAGRQQGDAGPDAAEVEPVAAPRDYVVFGTRDGLRVKGEGELANLNDPTLDAFEFRAADGGGTDLPRDGTPQINLRQAEIDGDTRYFVNAIGFTKDNGGRDGFRGVAIEFKGRDQAAIEKQALDLFRATYPDAPAAARSSEATQAGDQLLTEGTAPITAADRLAAAQAAPLRGGDAAADGGLFDMAARDQFDMFSDAAQGSRTASDAFDDPVPDAPAVRAQAEAAENAIRDAIARGEDVSFPTGRTVDGEAEFMSARAALDDLDADQDFLDMLNVCKS